MRNPADNKVEVLGYNLDWEFLLPLKPLISASIKNPSSMISLFFMIILDPNSHIRETKLELKSEGLATKGAEEYFSDRRQCMAPPNLISGEDFCSPI